MYLVRAPIAVQNLRDRIIADVSGKIRKTPHNIVNNSLSEMLLKFYFRPGEGNIDKRPEILIRPRPADETVIPADSILIATNCKLEPISLFQPLDLNHEDGLILCGHVVARGFFTHSDAQLKDDIRLLEVDVREKLAVYRYKADLSAREHVGLLAQEVQREFPSAVLRQPDGYLAVDYAQLVPVLIQDTNAIAKWVECVGHRIDILESNATSQGAQASQARLRKKTGCPVVQPHWLPMDEAQQTFDLLQCDRFVVLHGKSGVGKTSVAACVAHQWDQDVSWIVTPEKRARKPEEFDALVCCEAERGVSRLVVFDDALHIASDDIQNLITRNPQWTVLVVTTDDRIVRETKAKRIRLGDLSTAPSLWVLLSQTWREMPHMSPGASISDVFSLLEATINQVTLNAMTRAAILRVVDLCEGLMIALALGGSMMRSRRNEGMSLTVPSGWDDLFKDLSSGRAMGHADRRYIVLDNAVCASMKAMHAKNRDALLRLSVFDEPDIPLQDLKAVWCDCDAQERFNELVDYGFLSVSKKETVRIHQLVLNSIKKRAGMVFQSRSMVRFAYADNTGICYVPLYLWWQIIWLLLLGVSYFVSVIYSDRRLFVVVMDAQYVLAVNVAIRLLAGEYRAVCPSALCCGHGCTICSCC
eukprot:TRINITY_DN4695_c0_g2_i1.p1 TRINITY_DN4695_c0_g2~~TRINITY_DN4695_c0_g2_i1.p1  ORF type:complete len:644 (+),score=58.86 TRINITY_DN4695_c0_g2_i1:138-2069(+)